MKKPTILDRMAGRGVGMDARNAIAAYDDKDAQRRHNELLENMKRKKRKKAKKMAMAAEMNGSEMDS